MAITTRKLGQVLNIYEGEGGALMCQLLMKRAECYNNFEGLDENGERCISSKLELVIEVSFLDESRCWLKGITTREFTVHACDWIEIENRKKEIVTRILVKDINISCSEHKIKDTDDLEIVGGCGTDLYVEFDTEAGFFNMKEK